MAHFNISVYRMSQARAAERAQAKRNELCAIVLELVHPEHVAVCPPSPRWLEGRAVLMGLVTWDEVVKHSALLH